MDSEVDLDFFEINGSQGEGGGQILRTSVSLASILDVPIRVNHIRAGRDKPGLKPQHVQAVLAAAKICNANVSGTSVGSTVVEYNPGNVPKHFKGLIDTGTAGCISLIAQTLVPIALFRAIDLEFEIVGGTEVRGGPTIDYLSEIVLPAYRLAGGDVRLEVMKRGYYPKGGGKAALRVNGSRSKIRPVNLPGQSHDYGKTKRNVNVLSVCRSLPEHTALRQLNAAIAVLSSSGINAKIIPKSDAAGFSLSPGSSVLVSELRESERFVGASSLGERGKRAEQVGAEAAHTYVKESRTRPSVDSHLADMLVTLLSCVPEPSSFTTPEVTEHLRTNMAVARQLTGCTFGLDERIDGSGNSIVLINGRKTEKSI